MWLPKVGETFFHFGHENETGMAERVEHVDGNTVKYRLVGSGRTETCAYPEKHIRTADEGVRWILAGVRSRNEVEP